LEAKVGDTKKPEDIKKLEDIKYSFIYMDTSQKIQIRLKQISQFNNANLNNLPQIFQCRKCRKYNTIISYQILKQNCYFCSNPNYIKNK
jgi:hypothetical protein